MVMPSEFAFTQGKQAELCCWWGLAGSGNSPVELGMSV